jgi:RNA recognition motif-containing protein
MSKDLYVKNLPAEMTEEELRKLFSVAGKVSYIHMGTDTRSGQDRAYAYIKMASETEAKEAVLCLDEARIGNRQISVSIARPQKSAPEKDAAAPQKKVPFKPRGKPRK